MTLTFLNSATKRFAYGVLAASLLAGLFVQQVDAAPVAIVNHSFELPDAGGSFVAAVPDGWLGSSGLNAFVEDTAAVGMSGGEGAQYLGLDSDNGYIYQDLGIPFAPNTTYTADLASAHRETFTHSTAEFGLFSSDAIGSDVGTAGFMDVQGVWDGSGNPDGDNMWNTFRDASHLATLGSGALGQPYSFTTGAAAPTGNVVVFVRMTTGGRVNVDNIRLDASPVPEPATIVLLAGSGLAFSVLRKRQ